MSRTTSATKLSVPAGATSQYVLILETNATITVIPGATGSMNVDYSTSPVQDLTNNTATWAAWPLASVVVRTSDVLVGRIAAVRATAATVAGTLEVAQ